MMLDNPTINSYTRMEHRFLLSQAQADLFRHAIEIFMIIDDQAAFNGYYPVHTLYYDSPDFRCYWEKLDGYKFRRKLRIRHYSTMDNLNVDAPVFAEIKQQVGCYIQKRRVKLTCHAALKLCEQGFIPTGYPQDEELMQEMVSFIHEYDLHPASRICFERQAYTGTMLDKGLRITLDKNVTGLDLTLKTTLQDAARPILAADQVIVEIKANSRLPFWLSEIIAQHSLTATSTGKYCRSLDAYGHIPKMTSSPAFILG